MQVNMEKAFYIFMFNIKNKENTLASVFFIFKKRLKINYGVTYHLSIFP